MTKDKDLKRIVRSRMQKTGESYTAARRVIVAGSPQRTPDYAALAGMTDEAVRAKTGRDWAGWVRILDGIGAAGLSHREIAAWVHAQGIPDWWTQTVTVGFERIRGLREIGQRREGSWEATRSRTFGVPVETLFRAFENARTRARWLPRTKLTIRTSAPNKSMRILWNDGSAVDLRFTAKGGARSSVAVQHRKLATRAASNVAKAFWSERLDALGQVLGTARRL